MPRRVSTSSGKKSISQEEHRRTMQRLLVQTRLRSLEVFLSQEEVVVIMIEHQRVR